MMTMIDRVRGVDASEYQDLHSISDDVDHVLWIMVVCDEKCGIEWMTANEIAEISTSSFRRAISRQKVASALAACSGLVARRRRGGETRYCVMKQGSERVKQAARIVIVDPNKPFTALKSIDEILGGLSGPVRICDPYIDDRTLTTCTAIADACDIRFLSLNVSDPPQFRRKLSAYGREHNNLELRISSVRDLHDRYIADDKNIFTFGQSINGLGKKQSFIIPLGPDMRISIVADFDRRWNAAKKWA